MEIEIEEYKGRKFYVDVFTNLSESPCSICYMKDLCVQYIEDTSWMACGEVFPDRNGPYYTCYKYEEN